MESLRANVTGLIVAGSLSAWLLAMLLIPQKPLGAQGAAGALQDDAAGQTDRANPQREPAPPQNQTYIGTTKCAACHFEQFLDWRQQQEKHSKAFDVLPARYRSNAECLKCHTTGYGEKTGFAAASDRHLAGVTCEACHGPGSAHAEVSKPFAKKKNLTPEEEKTARESIYLMLPQNVCVTCHSSRGHQKHPKYEK